MASALEDARPAEAKRSHRQLRAWLVALVRKNLSRYEAKWDRTDSKGVPTKQTFKEFIDLLANQGSWAGRFEAETMAAALNLKLLAHTSWDEIMEINPEGKTSVCFYFDYQIGHWEFVKAADPKRWLQRWPSLPSRSILAILAISIRSVSGEVSTPYRGSLTLLPRHVPDRLMDAMCAQEVGLVPHTYSPSIPPKGPDHDHPPPFLD